MKILALAAVLATTACVTVNNNCPETVAGDDYLSPESGYAARETVTDKKDY